MKIRSPTASRRAQCLAVRFEERFLAAVLLGEEALDLLGIEVQQRRQRTQIDDVLEQLPLANVAVGLVADRRQRYAECYDVVAELRRRQRLRRVVEQVPARLDLGDVLVPRLRIHRDHQVHAAAASPPSRFDDAHLVPRRQALDVRRKDVARRHRDTHPQDCPREEAVCGRRARAVDVRELDDEVVDANKGIHTVVHRTLSIAPSVAQGPERLISPLGGSD
jgi:hypothetical protein